MRNLYCLLFLVFFAASASAQRVYFIYLQSDNGLPFYVKMNDNVLSSSQGGYLILPNLKDSTYIFSIGLPTTKSEGKFRLTVAGKDKGYLIRNVNDGVQLFDLQMLNIIKPIDAESRKSGSYRMRNDDFTLLLSKAARDSSLLWVPVLVKEDVAVVTLKPETPKTEPEQQKPEQAITKSEEIKGNDTVAIAKTEPAADTTDIAKVKVEAPPGSAPEENMDSVSQKSNQADSTAVNTIVIAQPLQFDTVAIRVEEKSEPYKRSTVRKRSESSTSEGFGLVFYDESGDGTDTIRLLIPNPRIILRDDVSSEKDDELFLKLNRDSLKQEATQPSKKQIPKSNCTSVANESDFFKLRKNMASEDTDEEMVEEAKKYFKSKCFSTEQIKNLSTLFLTSAGKYLFFDAAYMHVTDQELFPSLGTEIRDEYYSKRFKALIGE